MGYGQLYISLLVIILILPSIDSVNTTNVALAVSTRSNTSTNAAPNTSLPSPTSTKTTNEEYPEYPPDLGAAVFVLEMEFVFNGDYDYIMNSGQADDVKHFYEQRFRELFGNYISVVRNLTVVQITKGSVILITKVDISVEDILRLNRTVKSLVEDVITMVEYVDLDFESLTIAKNRTVQKLTETATEAEGLEDYCDAVGVCLMGYDCIYRSLNNPVPSCVHKCNLHNNCGWGAECFFDELRGVTSCRCKDSGHYDHDSLSCVEDNDLSTAEIVGIVLGVITAVYGLPAFITIFIKLIQKRKKPGKYAPPDNPQV